jgi:asparagine synthase (glutamine-hydrolysing)
MKDPVEWYLRKTMFMPPALLAEVRGAECLGPVLARRRAIFEEGRRDHVTNCLKYEMQTYLVSLLTRQDKMMMAHSVEDRVPFLDNAVVDFVRSLPSEYLVRGAWGRARGRSRATKRALKALALRYFDAAFVYRRKVGFDVPLRPCFSSPRFRELMEERLLPGMQRRGILRVDVVRDWWKRACTHTAMEGPFWNCMAFEIWAQQFVDGGHGCGEACFGGEDSY